MQDTVYISQLEPLIAPEGVGFWPPAPGWYLLACLLLFFSVFAGILLLRKYRVNQYRRFVLESLSQLAEEAGMQPDQKHLQELNHLLKQTALQVWPRDMVAALSGAQWETFLESTVKNRGAASPSGKLSDKLLYAEEQQRIEQGSWKELLDFSNLWIRKHRNFEP